MYGRTESEWEQLIDEAVGFLEEHARAETTVAYTELNNALVLRTGQPAFDFSREVDRKAVGDLLGEVVERTFSEVGAMISAITVYKSGNDAGPGFYTLASEKGLLTPNASPDQRMDFWMTQMIKVYAYYGAR
ncbi:hypothetical protein HNR06_005318 [Nocardiopsis arvandica]|uniref:Uncharacterized protein n=1 Tax=Nocardiopsis sinuspersici TaxID=501010 RepID=A0A7Z0BNQ0_9ACTN|nr:hypothetical protein [Nocardiopsis sinuspersici]NYH55729.1 hypothetical protein [Nocardiopsis sinuspersici]